MNPDSSLADPQQIIADLQRELAETKTERDGALAREREALEQQTATADVLQVINSSPGDLAPVFDAILEKAHSLCGAELGVLFTYDGERFWPAAGHGASTRFLELTREGFRPAPDNPFAQVAAGERLVHIVNVAEFLARGIDDPGLRIAVEMGIRTFLIVPLRKDGRLLGVITANRREVRPFTDKQIALLQNFAAQAVIAMENARLITETREALEQQTATAEVLGVINSSPSDLAPVFDAMLEKAHNLCGIAQGSLELYDGERFRAVACRGLSDAFAEILRQGYPASDNPATRPLIEGQRFSYIPDLTAADYSVEQTAAETEGVRTLLCVPLRREGQLLGMIASARREVRPFIEKEIALLENFAAQAVIAMENARLLAETRERTAELQTSLEYQTATSDVLNVISRSTFDLQPVLDSVVETAARLCAADSALISIREGEAFRVVATLSFSPEYDAFIRGRLLPLDRGTISGRTALEGHVVHVADIALDPEYKMPETTGLENIRTMLGVPLLRENVVAGTINLGRQRIEPFTDRQIELVRTFADQAVIAIENTRLITETREALEQQTATAEVLGVINSSPGDLTPVFDAMLEKAMRLCDAAFGALATFDGAMLRTAATRGVPPEYAQYRMTNPPAYGPNTAPGRFIAGERLIHNIDLKAEDAYLEGEPNRRALVDLGGARSALQVALRKDDALLGSMTIYRKEVRPFTDKQIALLQNFAAQAVIAMENARLITETREALEQQTATSEVLGVINSSPGDLAPVFDAMLEKATSLCDAPLGTLWLFDGEHINPVATRGASPELAKFLAGPRPPNPVQQHQLHGGGTIQLADLRATALYQDGDILACAVADLGGIQTVLSVPLRREDRVLGLFGVYRQEIRPFSDKQIALIENFAQQAVIAMENARLITETREALEQQTATAEVLGVINSSPGNLTPVFDAMLDKALRFCEAAFGVLWTYEGESTRAVAMRGVPAAFAQVLAQGAHPVAPDNALGILRDGGSLVHFADAADTDAYRAGDPLRRAMVDLGGARTMLGVPLRKDDAALGIFVIYRQEVRQFTDKQIALLQNFAAQAVIAMENARLITETQEALDQQTATTEVLQVINSSPGDLAPVFDAMLEKAMRLCEADFGSLWTFSSDRFRPAAHHGLPEAYARYLSHEDVPAAGPRTGRARLLAGERFAHIRDLAEEEPYRAGEPHRRALVDLGGARTALLVPLRKDATVIGFIMVYRQEVRPFADKQIALLQNFAAQAVIAMENARLITETREALEQQTATAEVLGVINSSPGDLDPVFEVMVARAAHLCEADEAAVRSFDGQVLHLVTTHGTDPSALERLRGLGPTELMGLYEPFAHGAAIVHYVDARDTDAYRTYPAGRQRIDARGIRSWLAVALRKEGTLLGIINVHRREVRPFSDKQIALLQSFAAQAVIAMENARLLEEIRQRQAELRVTFDNMADAVAMFDQTLHLAAWNRNFQELLKLPDDLLAERPGFDEYIRYLTERGEFGERDPEREIARLRSRLGDHYGFERTRPDGTVIEVRNNPMPDGGTVVIYSDITERKRSEAQISAAKDTAEAAYRDLQAAQSSLIQAQKMAALGQLTAGIAHEIKNPLNFVNNFASLSTELLDELRAEVAPVLGSLDEGKREDLCETFEMLTGNLDKIVEHGQRADNIVKSMLEHSRGVSGERREVDLNAVIDEALNLAYHGARAQDQGFNITLQRDYAESLTPVEVAPQEITRVFLNLFGNGFYAANKRARENGGDYRPILTVTTRESDDGIEVRVRDNGIGIPAEIKDKLFQPFFTTKPTGEGTGLGLSISYDIVTQQHGGTITVESEPGSFTEFTVRLPRH